MGGVVESGVRVTMRRVVRQHGSSMIYLYCCRRAPAARRRLIAPNATNHCLGRYLGGPEGSTGGLVITFRTAVPFGDKNCLQIERFVSKTGLKY